jgi:HAD superfamily hydrolase (TIGR01509 family)
VTRRACLPDVVLFDWDGTLLDSRNRMLSVWHACTDEHLGRRWPMTPADEVLVFTAAGGDLFPFVAGGPDAGIALEAAFQRLYEVADVPVQAFPGVTEMLSDLRAAGLRTGVVTNKTRARYDDDAREAGLTGLVDVVVCDGDAAACKPDPAPVLHALAVLGTTPERSIMVGDTDVDVAAAAAAGVRPIGVGWGATRGPDLLAAGADAIVDDVPALVAMVLGR